MMKVHRNIETRVRIVAATTLAMLLVVLLLPASAERIVTITDADHGKTIELRKGDTLVISLESNPSTGYGWQVGKNDAAVLKPIGAGAFEPPSHRMPGAPGHQLFKFEALSVGSDAMELRYLRPWEKGVAPAKTFGIVVTVK